LQGDDAAVFIPINNGIDNILPVVGGHVEAGQYKVFPAKGNVFVIGAGPYEDGVVDAGGIDGILDPGMLSGSVLFYGEYCGVGGGSKK